MKYHFIQKDRHLWRILLLIVFAVATVSVRATNDIRKIKLMVNGELWEISLANKPVITYSGDQLHITITDPETADQMEADADVTKISSFKFKGAPDRGDANGDNDIDAKDISIVANYIVGKTLEKFEPWGADFNGDNKVDAIDISEIISKIINKQ